MSGRREGNPLSRVLVAVVWIVCLGLSTNGVSRAGEGPDQLRWDLARGFEFEWKSVEVSTKVLKGDSPDLTELTLAISLQVRIVDEPGWETIDVNRPTIHEALDQDGLAVECLPDKLCPVRLYEKDGWRWDSQGTHPPKAEKRYDGTLLVRLPVDVNHPVPALLSELTGYIHVLDGKVIKIDVPFDARRDGWLEFAATPDLLFGFNLRATTAPPGPLAPREEDLPLAWYKYETYVKSQAGQSILPVRDVLGWYPRHVYPLGGYAIIRTELFDSQRNAATPLFREYILTDHTGMAHCSGEMAQTELDYDMIRHVIVIGPADWKVPFVLTDIPVPTLQPPGK